jgi:hypothetical protein
VSFSRRESFFPAAEIATLREDCERDVSVSNSKKTDGTHKTSFEIGQREDFFPSLQTKILRALGQNSGSDN